MQISGALRRLVTVTPKLTSKGHVRINQCKERAHYQSKVGNYLLSLLSCASMVPTAVRLSAATERQTHTPSRARAHAQAPAAKRGEHAHVHALTPALAPAHAPQRRPVLFPAHLLFSKSPSWLVVRPRIQRPCGVEWGGLTGLPEDRGQSPHNRGAEGGRAESSLFPRCESTGVPNSTKEPSFYAKPSFPRAGPLLPLKLVQATASGQTQRWSPSLTHLRLEVEDVRGRDSRGSDWSAWKREGAPEAAGPPRLRSDRRLTGGLQALDGTHVSGVSK